MNVTEGKVGLFTVFLETGVGIACYIGGLEVVRSDRKVLFIVFVGVFVER